MLLKPSTGFDRDVLFKEVICSQKNILFLFSQSKL